MGCKIEPLSEWDIGATREMCANLSWNIRVVLGITGWFWQGMFCHFDYSKVGRSVKIEKFWKANRGKLFMLSAKTFESPEIHSHV